MKAWVFLLFLIIFSACSDDTAKPKNSGIYAITESGVANYWKLTLLNQETWNFEDVGDNIKLGGFWYGASTILNDKLIVYTSPSLKQVNLNTGQLIKEIELDKYIYGLEYSSSKNLIFTMVKFSSSGYKLSKLDYETGATTIISDSIVFAQGVVAPTTLANDKYFIIGGDENTNRKIISFDTQNGSILNEVDLPEDFPLHLICGLEFNVKTNLIYFLNQREDQLFDLMTLNIKTFKIAKFSEGINLNETINSTLIDRSSNTYIIQSGYNGSLSAPLKLTMINLDTKRISEKSSDKGILEFNQYK